MWNPLFMTPIAVLIYYIYLWNNSFLIFLNHINYITWVLKNTSVSQNWGKRTLSSYILRQFFSSLNHLMMATLEGSKEGGSHSHLIRSVRWNSRVGSYNSGFAANDNYDIILMHSPNMKATCGEGRPEGKAIQRREAAIEKTAVFMFSSFSHCV